MDSQSIEEGNKAIEKYSGLDQSLKLIQSLVSHRVQKLSQGHEVQQNQNLGAAPEYTDNGFAKDEDMENQNEESFEDVKMEGEDQPQSIHDKSIGSDTLSLHDAMNVEERLYMMDNIYKERRREKLKAAEEERKLRESHTKPIINKKSQKMLENKGNRVGKIEDRLLTYAKKQQKVNEVLEKSMSEKSTQSALLTKDQKPAAVVNRLMDYGKLYEQKRFEREQKFLKSQTFKPNIEKSNDAIQVKSRYKNPKGSNMSPNENTENQNFLKYTRSNVNSDTDRIIRDDESSDPDNDFGSRLYNSGFKEPSKKMQQIQDNYDKNHPFHPKIDDASKAIAENKFNKDMTDAQDTSVHERLYSLHFTKKNNNEDDTEFRPQLNKNSEEIIRLMKEGNDYDKTNRWRSLYNLGVERQIIRKKMEEEIRQLREEETLENYSFKPQIISYQSEKSEDQPKDVVDRTKEWASTLEMKKDLIAESYCKNKMIREQQECTFKPRLIAEEKLKERNITTSELSSRVDIQVNPGSLESFYKRMSEVHFRKRLQEEYEENYCGSGKNWVNKLTLPTIPDFNEKKPLPSLEQVKCITKPVIRDGEIVKDPFIQIYRHENYKKSNITNALRGEGKEEDFDEIKKKNDNLRDELFEENIEFDDCVDFLHSQIRDLDI